MATVATDAQRRTAAPMNVVNLWSTTTTTTTTTRLLYQAAMQEAFIHSKAALHKQRNTVFLSFIANEQQ